MSSSLPQSGWHHRLGLLLTPLSGYPALFLVSAVWDHFLGERRVIHLLHHERRLLWDTFWADFLLAIPAFYLWVGLGFLAWVALVRSRILRSRAWLSVFMVASGWGIGSFLSGVWAGPESAVGASTGLLLSIPLAGFAGWLVPSEGQ